MFSKRTNVPFLSRQINIIISFICNTLCIHGSSFFVICKLWHDISNNVVCATSKASDQPANTRSLISICLALDYSMSVMLLTEHHFEFLSLKGGAQARLSL